MIWIQLRLACVAFDKISRWSIYCITAFSDIDFKCQVTLVYSCIRSNTLIDAGATTARQKNSSPERFAEQISLVTSETVIQNVCILAGSLFYIA